MEEWLNEVGLGHYWPTFESSGYKEPSDLEDLKGMEKDSLKEPEWPFKQTGIGHSQAAIS